MSEKADYAIKELIVDLEGKLRSLYATAKAEAAKDLQEILGKFFDKDKLDAIVKTARPVSPAVRLHGRFIGLLNAVPKTMRPKAKVIRNRDGIEKAISFLEAQRAISRGKKAQKKAKKS
jgi:aminopeptidase N